ncbi:MAG: nucleotidyltransferase domain-containing protein [Chloroflexota bacterium]|nr:nucleotidyltransferase domain-containing protein [Chloroflexota bacterium]
MGLRNLKKLKHLTGQERAALEEFVARVRESYEEEIARITLFGSKVRGDFDEESDVDLLMVVEHRNSQLWDDVVAIEMGLMLKYGIVISSLIMGYENYEWHRQHRAPLYCNVEREGVDLWTSIPRSSSLSG